MLVDSIGHRSKHVTITSKYQILISILTAVQESLTVPLIEHAADYAEDGSGKASPLWTLTTKVSFEKQ